MSEKAASRTSVHSIVPRPVLYWVLVGHWEGSPFPIMRGQTPPPFSVWSVTDKQHWEELRSEKYYTRRSKSRPIAKVDREFQKQTGKDVFDDADTTRKDYKYRGICDACDFPLASCRCDD